MSPLTSSSLPTELCRNERNKAGDSFLERLKPTATIWKRFAIDLTRRSCLLHRQRAWSCRWNVWTSQKAATAWWVRHRSPQTVCSFSFTIVKSLNHGMRLRAGALHHHSFLLFCHLYSVHVWGQTGVKPGNCAPRLWITAGLFPLQELYIIDSAGKQPLVEASEKMVRMPFWKNALEPWAETSTLFSLVGGTVSALPGFWPHQWEVFRQLRPVDGESASSLPGSPRSW